MNAARLEDIEADHADDIGATMLAYAPLLASLLLHWALIAHLPDWRIAAPRAAPPINVFVLAPPRQSPAASVESPPPSLPAPPPRLPADPPPVRQQPPAKAAPPSPVESPSAPELKRVPAQAPPRAPAARRQTAPMPKSAAVAPTPAPPAREAPQPAQRSSDEGPPAAPAMATAAPEPPASAPSEASTTSAPSPTPKRDPQALLRYAQALSQRFARGQSYPRLAAMRGWQGEVTLLLTIDRGGRLLSVRVVNSSGHEVLDRSAIALVEDGGPLPPPPETIEGGQLEVMVPVRYKLNAG